MTNTRRFLFETSFDEGFRPYERQPEPEPPPPEPEPEPEVPPEPTFSQADLLQAHEDGYADGFQAGKSAAESAAATRLAAALTRIEGHLAHLAGGLEAETRARRDEAVEIGLAVARRLLPATARANALAEVEGAIASAVAEMIDEPRLVIRVSEAMLEEIADRLDALTTARGFAGRVVLLPEPALDPGDCRIEWAEGGVERATGRFWKDLDALAARRARASQERRAEPPPTPPPTRSPQDETQEVLAAEG